MDLDKARLVNLKSDLGLFCKTDGKMNWNGNLYLLRGFAFNRSYITYNFTVWACRK